MTPEQQALVYGILKQVATAPRVPLASDTPFLDGMLVRQPTIDLVDTQVETLCEVLNELAPEGDYWHLEHLL